MAVMAQSPKLPADRRALPPRQAYAALPRGVLPLWDSPVRRAVTARRLALAAILGLGVLPASGALAQEGDEGGGGTGGGGSGFLRSPGFDAAGQALPPSAPAFSALEAFGFSPAVSGPGAANARGYSINPTLGLSVLGTDNLNFSQTNKQSEAIFTLLPGLWATADTARLRGSLSYYPTLSYYANSPNQNRINNYLNGAGRVEIIPEAVFLDLRGYGSVAATSGGFAPAGTPQVTRNNQVQTYGFQAAPYYVQRFGTLATMNLGYAYRWTDQTGNNAFAPGSNTPFFTSQTSQGNQGWLVVRSGEDFGRFLVSLRLIGTVFSGTGIFNDAHQYTASVQGSYAVNRWLAVLGEIGYEDARYNGVLPYIVEQVTWGAGVRIQPSVDSSIIAAIRQRDGFVSPFANVALSLTSRIRFTGNYRETLSTSSAQSLDLLNAITYDALGNPIDASAGMPLVIPFAGTPLGALGGPLDGGLYGGAGGAGASSGGSFLANQSSLLRSKFGSASISQVWERDALSLSYFYSQTTPVAVAAGTTAFQQSGSSIGITWSHLLSDVTSITTYGSYGRYTTQGQQSNSATYSARVLLSHRLTERLFGSLQYAYTSRGSTFSTGSASQNLVIATLRVAF